MERGVLPQESTKLALFLERIGIDLMSDDRDEFQVLIEKVDGDVLLSGHVGDLSALAKYVTSA